VKNLVFRMEKLIFDKCLNLNLNLKSQLAVAVINKNRLGLLKLFCCYAIYDYLVNYFVGIMSEELTNRIKWLFAFAVNVRT
jgi:hypothetical protein